MKVAAVIPAYQAEASVGAVVAGTRKVMGEVLVVDDGSDDGTAEAAEAAGARVVRHRRNCGKGRALATAFRTLFEDGWQAVVTLDADGQHLPEEIPRLLAASRGGEELVIGTRDHLFEQMSAVRKASNRCSSSLISILAGRPLTDIQSGFRLYSRGLIAATGFPESRFEAESAVVVRAARLGLPVISVPIRLGFADGRCTSHYRPLIDSLRIAGAVFQARWDSRRLRRIHQQRGAR
ncbi:MAG: glycosyltransferase family 2 protein [Acidobacteriota bacterium]